MGRNRDASASATCVKQPDVENCPSYSNFLGLTPLVTSTTKTHRPSVSVPILNSFSYAFLLVTSTTKTHRPSVSVPTLKFFLG